MAINDKIKKSILSRAQLEDILNKICYWYYDCGNWPTQEIDEYRASKKISGINATMNEPKIHSHIDDCLDEDSKLAYETIYCSCGVMVHAGNNECMQTWVETGAGNFCLKCFAKFGEVLPDHLGLQR